MKKLIAAWMMVLALSASAGTFETEDYFAITLPQGWVQVPEDVLVQYNEANIEADENAQVYEYAFQYKTSDQWLSYPCILVQVNNFGRYSTGELGRFAEESSGEQLLLDEDKALFMEVREEGDIKVVVARQLTEYGYIEFNGYSTVDAFSEFEPVFLEAFSTLKIDDVIRYTPQITDNAPVVGSINLGKVILVFIQAALVGGALWIIYSLFRRIAGRKPKEA